MNKFLNLIHYLSPRVQSRPNTRVPPVQAQLPGLFGPVYRPLWPKFGMSCHTGRAHLTSLVQLFDPTRPASPATCVLLHVSQLSRPACLSLQAGTSISSRPLLRPHISLLYGPACPSYPTPHVAPTRPHPSRLSISARRPYASPCFTPA